MTSARILRGGGDRGKPLLADGVRPSVRRRMVQEELQARLTAEMVLQDAKEKAKIVLAEARDRGVTEAAAAARAACEQADVELLARWTALRQAEGRKMEAETDRVIALAVMLAERLVAATLELSPERIGTLARSVIAEARGMRRAVIHAHPLDVEPLARELAASGLDASCYSVSMDEGLRRGELHLHTDVGIIQAKLSDRLTMLASVLREVLR